VNLRLSKRQVQAISYADFCCLSLAAGEAATNPRSGDAYEELDMTSRTEPVYKGLETSRTEPVYYNELKR